MSDDDVIDYLVMEAVAMKVSIEAQNAQEQADRESWKAKHTEMRNRLNNPGANTSFE